MEIRLWHTKVILPWLVICLLLTPEVGYTYVDDEHYSKVFESKRQFRVFMPLAYDAVNLNQRFPVLYYFHGCGGSYKSSGPYSYLDYGLEAPEAMGREYQEDYQYANNVDFENLATEKELIIVAVDGRIAELPEGCQVYFPSLAETWSGNYYNFSAYIKELVEVVDSKYLTISKPEFRAVTGLSMGGHMATWIAATNPNLFSSASQFCYGPSYYDVGQPKFQTTVDITELWRNLAGLPFRHSTTDRDYLKHYTAELFLVFQGAGFQNEFFEANYCHHAAARMDLQVEFHMAHFGVSREEPKCFSYINLYPNFKVWDYEIVSDKRGSGWIYMHNVSKNGLGLYTRKRLPWGRSLDPVSISLMTPENYNPTGSYIISRYDYRNGHFSQQHLQADAKGRLSISAIGGMGEEIGILGEGLEPPIILLLDTINENIYVEPNRETILNMAAVNLSGSKQTVDFTLTSSNVALLNIIEQPARLTIPAYTKIEIDSFATCWSAASANDQRIAYLSISSSISGSTLEKLHRIQINVKQQKLLADSTAIQIFDGHSKSLPLFKYAWNKWHEPLTSGQISEGMGNGNGIPELGETFSIWVQPALGFDTLDTFTWHPTVPVNASGNPDVLFNQINHHRMSTGRSLRSAEMQLTRLPTEDHPILIPMQVELLRVQKLENDCHRNTADQFAHYYFDVILQADGTCVISGENKR